MQSALPENVLRGLRTALAAIAGGPVAIGSASAVTEGWSARFAAWPWITRCAVAGPPGWGVTSVIVKALSHWPGPWGGCTPRREDTTRLVRLPKLLAGDEPHPMGFSRRGQLLDTIQVAVDAAATAGTLPALCAWFEQAIAGLRRRWPHLPAAQKVYPAFRASSIRSQLSSVNGVS